MAKVKDITDFFEGFAPVCTAMEFDNVGLLAGDKNADISKVLLTLDITAEVVEEAARNGCELIISHHPVIFRPLKRLDAKSAAYQLAKLAEYAFFGNTFQKLFVSVNRFCGF